MTKIKAKAGLLPFYIKLYDDILPDVRKIVEEFYNSIADILTKKGIEIIKSPVCRIKQEFENAVNMFETMGACSIITLHLAYSPSMESIDVLTKTKLPLIILDTTPDFCFGLEKDEQRIMYNHGIHGVQDMCSMLLRNNKNFFIEAGHYLKSDVIDRVVSWIYAAGTAHKMKNHKVGIIGNAFKGMGDFYVSENKLYNDMGIQTVKFDKEDSKKYLSDISENDIEKELTEWKNSYDGYEKIDTQTLTRTAEVTLMVEKWIQEKNIDSFTFNFFDITKENGFKTVPFIAASRLMSKGTGYAGEGDTITSCLTGVLLSRYDKTSFVEMFCPDWENDMIFISHMGEMNLSLCSGKAEIFKKDYIFSDTHDPAVACGCFKDGKAVLVNLSPLNKGKYRLILSKVDLKSQKDINNMKGTVRGWFKPCKKVSSFLEEYSLAGGTHHCAIVYGENEVLDMIKKFGMMMDWEIIVI